MRHGLALLLGGMCAVGAIPRATVAQQVPIVTLPAASAKTAETFGAIINIRELPGGSLLVDDGARKEVRLLTPNLASGTVVLDSTPGTPNWYGTFPVPLFAYLADTTLFPRARTVSVLDGHGTITRSLAMPTVSDATLLRRGAADNTGRLLYQGTQAVTRKAAVGIPPTLSDSVPLLRADLASRRTDTIAYLVRPMTRVDAVAPTGRRYAFWDPNPLREIDEWAVLTDGSVAIVRGHDYHVDWIRPDGSKVSTPKLPFDWRQLSEADKARMVDSVQAQWITAAEHNTIVAATERGPTPYPPVRPGSAAAAAASDTANAVYSSQPVLGRVRVFLPDRATPDQVFDYYPPVRSGAAMADLDDHLWILPTTSKQSQHGELVYDVVNTNGELIERVRVPLGRYIVGFGQDGVVYLASGNLTSGFSIERSKVPVARSKSER